MASLPPTCRSRMRATAPACARPTDMAGKPAAAGRGAAGASGGAASPPDPGAAIHGYRGARRRLVARLAVSALGGWASGLMLALLGTSALLAGVVSLSAG